MGDPDFRCVSIPSCSKFSFCLLCSLLNLYFLLCVVKRQPKLKSKYNKRVEKAIEYALMIESWDDLVDPRTLAFYNVGPDPSSYVLHTLIIEEKKE